MKTNWYLKTLFALLITFSFPVTMFAEGTNAYLIHTGGENCKQGLHTQPNGPFSVFLFCDDGLGENIGVICTEPGAGPGSIELPPPKVWSNWHVNNRFWQDASWATNVTSFAWSPSKKYLFVATNKVYGDGQLHQIDLVNRSSKIIKLKNEVNYDLNEYEVYTIINEIDLSNKILRVSMYLLSPDNKEIRLKDEIKLD